MSSGFLPHNIYTYEQEQCLAEEDRKQGGDTGDKKHISMHSSEQMNTFTKFPVLRISLPNCRGEHEKALVWSRFHLSPPPLYEVYSAMSPRVTAVAVCWCFKDKTPDSSNVACSTGLRRVAWLQNDLSTSSAIVCHRLPNVASQQWNETVGNTKCLGKKQTVSSLVHHIPHVFLSDWKVRISSPFVNSSRFSADSRRSSMRNQR